MSTSHDTEALEPCAGPPRHERLYLWNRRRAPIPVRGIGVLGWTVALCLSAAFWAEVIYLAAH